MSLHPPVRMDTSPTYPGLLSNALSSVGDKPARPRRISILPYKHASKWNSTMYKQHEPFTVTFDTWDAMTGLGVRHGDLASRNAGTMSSVIIGGGEPVYFPHPGRKIQFRIVWPGYDTVDFCGKIDITGITVSQLAGTVASFYTEFFDTAPQHECTPDGLLATPELLKTLRILAIRNTYANIYQAEIIVG